MEETKIISEAFNILYKKSPLIFSILAIIIIYFRNELKSFIKLIISWYLEKSGNRIARYIDLSKHSFFNYMKKCEQNIIPNIILENKIKERILKEFLLIKFSTFRENFYNFIKEENNYKKLNSFELQSSVIELFNRSISEYNEKTKKVFKEIGVDEKTTNYIVSSFDELHKNTVNIIESAIQDTCINPFLDSNKEKISQILDFLKFGFKITIEDGIKSFVSLNGKIDGLSLK